MWILQWFLWCATFLAINSLNKFETSLPGKIDIDHFLQMESAMILKGRNYLWRERERIDLLEIYLQEWKKWRELYFDQENEYVGIPQNIFHLFKKLTVDLGQVEKTMMQNSYHDTTILDNILLPSENHLKQVVLSLVNLQHLYNLQPTGIMNGTMVDLQLNTSLSLNACFFVGKTCSEFNKHLEATEWLDTCLSLSSNDEKSNNEVNRLLCSSYIFLNDTNQAYSYASKYLDEDYYSKEARDVQLDLAFRLGKLNDYDALYFETNRMCRGKHNETLDASRSYLKCSYNRENSAFLKIAPLKEEELYDDPKILLYRDVLYDSEIEKLKSWAANNLQIATLIGRDGKSGYKGFNYRVCETGFLNNRSPEFSKLSKRIEDISELLIESSEMWQILSYSPGGYYVTHSDYLPSNNEDSQINGNRITSMLFYFNEVILGGETVSPRINLSVKPIKGAAVIWYNIYADGSQNYLVDHSACPVVIGEKWGFTQWFRSKNQKSVRRIFEKKNRSRDPHKSIKH